MKHYSQRADIVKEKNRIRSAGSAKGPKEFRGADFNRTDLSGLDVNGNGFFKGVLSLYDPSNGTVSLGDIVRLQTSGGLNLSNP
jgi:hypothetical protein